MRYLGLDLSLSRTACVLLEDTRAALGHGTPKLDHVWTHYVQGPPGDFASSPARLRAMRDALLRVLSLADVDQMQRTCVEGYSYGNRGAQEQIAEWGGVARLALYESGFGYIDLAPARLKKFATGSGRGDKDGIRMEVLSRWGFKSTNNDEADAYVCARYAHAFGDRAGLIKAQLECFEKPVPIVVRPHVEPVR